MQLTVFFCPWKAVEKARLMQWLSACWLNSGAHAALVVSNGTYYEGNVLVFCLAEESSFCAGRPDGRYNIGCTSAYTACMNRRAIAMECPSSLVLDQPSGECLDEVSDHAIMFQRVIIVLR